MQIYIGRRGVSFTKAPWGDSGGWSIGVVEKAPAIKIRFFEGQLAGWELALHGEAAVPEPLLAGENTIGERGGHRVRLSELARLLGHVIELASSANTYVGRLRETLGDIEIVVDYYYRKNWELDEVYAIIGPRRPGIGKYGIINAKRLNSDYVTNVTIDVWGETSVEIDTAQLHPRELLRAPYHLRFSIYKPKELSRSASLIQSEPVLGEPEGIPVIHAPEEKRSLSLPANAPVVKIVGGEAVEQEGFRVYDYSYDRTQLYTMIYTFDKSAPVSLEVTEEGIHTRGPSDLETLIIDAYSLYNAFKLSDLHAFIDVGLDRAYMLLDAYKQHSLYSPGLVGKVILSEVPRYTFTSTIVEARREEAAGFVEVSTNLVAPIDITGAPGLLVEARTVDAGKPVYPNEKIWNELVAKYYEALGLNLI